MLPVTRLVSLLAVVALSCRSAGSGEPTRGAPSIAVAHSTPPSPPPEKLHLPPAAAGTASSSAGLAPDPRAPSLGKARTSPSFEGPLRVVVVGDSLSDPAAGGGGYLRVGLRGCSSKALVNLAKGGFMVNQMRRRLEREVRNGLGEASHVIVFGGVNDLYSDETAGRVPGVIIEDLAKIYELARSLRARVIGVTVAPWAGFSRWYNPKRGAATREVNAWIRQQLAEGKLDAVIDAHELLSCGDPERLCPEFEVPFRDGLHFGPAGHGVLGQALAAEFRDCR